MIKKKLGRIKRLKVRDVFDREDSDFTPWLNDNLDLLGKTLNLDIIDGIVEEKAGRFSCDILAKDSNSNRMIIIENQYYETDHDHLGKILTYSAVKDASFVIWVAEEFAEEHQKALEWLNENVDSESGISFFGVEIVLVQIGDSAIAPDFNIIVKPNDWERDIKRLSRPLNETYVKYLKFFSRLAADYKKMNPPKWQEVEAQAQSYLNFKARKKGLWFEWLFKGDKRFGVDLLIYTGNKDQNEVLYDKLYGFKKEIEGKLGELSWEKSEMYSPCRIAAYKKISDNIKGLPEDEYSDIIKWAVEKMKMFIETFGQYIGKL